MTVWLKFYEIDPDRADRDQTEPSAICLDAFRGLSANRGRGLTLYYSLPGGQGGKSSYLHGTHDYALQALEAVRSCHSPHAAGHSLRGIISSWSTMQWYSNSSPRYPHIIPTDSFWAVLSAPANNSDVWLDAPTAAPRQHSEEYGGAYRLALAEPTSSLLDKMSRVGHKFIDISGPR